MTTWETTIPEYRAIRENVAAMNDERLYRELAFANLADDPHPNARVWLTALEDERDQRRERGDTKK